MSNSTARFNRWEYQNIALAAVAQCAALVNSLAVRGVAPQVELVAAVNPLFELDPASTARIEGRTVEVGSDGTPMMGPMGRHASS